MITVPQFISQSLKPFTWKILISTLICLIWAVDLSLSPYLMKIIIDRIQTIVPAQAYSHLLWPAIAYVGLSGTVVFSFRIYEYVCLHLYPPLKAYIGEILMERMMYHSHQLYQNHFAGSLGNKIKDVMNGIRDLLEQIIDRFLAYTLAVAVAIVTLWTVNIKFALILSGWVVLAVSSTYFFSRKGSRLSHEASEQQSAVVGTIVDILSNMMNVRLFAALPYERKTVKNSLMQAKKRDQKRDWLFLKMFIVLGVSYVIYEGLSLFLLIEGFKQGYVTAGDFALVLSIGLGIAHCLWDLTRAMGNIAEYYGQITQGLNIVLKPVDIQDKPNAQPLHIEKGEIIFDKVHFHYKGAESLFNNKSVRIQGGEKVGLVGYSGSGKSTFVNLILRLFDIKSGKILIDGQNIQDITQDSLHQAIGMIPQDPVLFHRSLIDNIRYGKLDATDKEVMEAAKRAYAHDFITQLPQGYDSLVGERGVKLSGGQRQRIAIARAILKNAPILILDEATSQLDSVTEQEIQDSLWHLMQNKTTLVIAHRLSTLLEMDRILVFDQGKIVEDGTHKQLLAKKGLYKTLWDAQVGGFLPDEKN